MAGRRTHALGPGLNTEEQWGPLRGSQAAASSSRRWRCPQHGYAEDAYPGSLRLPRPAAYWVSAAPGLGQGGSRLVVSRSAQLELLSWARHSGLDLQPPEMLLCLSLLLFLLLPSKPPQTQWHKTTMSIYYSYCYHLAWSGSCGLSQFSLGVSPGCRRSWVEPSPRLPRAQVWWLMLAVGRAVSRGPGLERPRALFVWPGLPHRLVAGFPPRVNVPRGGWMEAVSPFLTQSLK